MEPDAAQRATIARASAAASSAAASSRMSSSKMVVGTPEATMARHAARCAPTWPSFIWCRLPPQPACLTKAGASRSVAKPACRAVAAATG